MTNQISTILIKYTSQTISKSDINYYKQLIDYFSTIPTNQLINLVCEYTELTIKQIKNEKFILDKILPKLEFPELEELNYYE